MKVIKMYEKRKKNVADGVQPSGKGVHKVIGYDL